MVVASTASRAYVLSRRWRPVGRFFRCGGSPVCTSAAAHLHRPHDKPPKQEQRGNRPEIDPVVLPGPLASGLGCVWSAKQALRPNPSVLQNASFQLQRTGNPSRAHPRGALVRSRAVLHGAWPLPARSTTRKPPRHAPDPGLSTGRLPAARRRRRSEEPGSRAAQ